MEDLDWGEDGGWREVERRGGWGGARVGWRERRGRGVGGGWREEERRGEDREGLGESGRGRRSRVIASVLICLLYNKYLCE